MSGSIGFSQIPPNILVPLVSIEFDASRALATSTFNQPVLLIGQTLNSQPVTPQWVPSLAQAQSLFGRGSMLARAYEKYVANDGFGQVFCIPAQQPTGVAAISTMTITGPATAAGTLALYIAGQSVPVTVAAGDTATAIAANVAAAVAANPDLPVGAAVSAGVATLTARHKGAVTGAIDVELNYYGALNGESTPAGLTIAFANPTAGSGDPDLSGLDAVMGDQPYDFVVSPYSDAAPLDNLQALFNNATGRWAPTRKSFGHGFSAVPGTASALATIGAARNDPHTTLFGYEVSPSPPWEVAAAITGAIAPALRADPARPVQTLQVRGILAPPAASRFTKSTQQTLLDSGIALMSYDQAGNSYVLRAVTTYQSNPFGQPDKSYLDTETLFNLMAVSRQLIAAFMLKYPRHKLADDGTRFAAGQPIITPAVAKGEIAAQYAIMEYNGLVEDSDAMLQSTIVQRNLADPNRLDILWAPYLIGGLRQVAIKNQFRLYSAMALQQALGIAA